MEPIGLQALIWRVAMRDLIEIKVLRKIRETTEPLLKNGCEISDICYRPFDMGVFGGKGYSLVLYKPPDRMLGVLFGDKPLTDKEIIRNVEEIQNILCEARKRT
jgi:hypothetical protein